MNTGAGRLKLVAIGASAGGVAALGEILPGLPAGFALPVVVVVHLPPARQSVMADLFGRRCVLPVAEAYDKAVAELHELYRILKHPRELAPAPEKLGGLFERTAVNADCSHARIIP